VTSEILTADNQLVFSSRGLRRLGKEVARVSDARRRVGSLFTTIEQSTMEGDTRFVLWSSINRRRRRVFVPTWYGDVEDGIEALAFWPENAGSRLSKKILWIERNFLDEGKTEPHEGRPFRTYLVTAEERHVQLLYDTPSRRHLEEISRECAGAYDFDSKRKEISPVVAARFIGEVDTKTVTPF